MTITCDKVPFTKKDAQSALNDIFKKRGRKSNRSRKECRAYPCDECGMWHLTSMDEDSYEIKSEQDLRKYELAQEIEKATSGIFYTLNGRLRDTNKRIDWLMLENSKMKQRINELEKPWWKRMFKKGDLTTQK